MITVTNRHGLPDAIVRAVLNDPYQRGDSDFTVTQLLKPPQIAHLEGQHETPEDVSERIWSLLGQAVHTVLERAAHGSPAIFEQRFAMAVTVDDRTYKVSGQVDHFEMGCLTDYKITSVYARGGKDEWEQQLNLLRLLLAANNREVARLQNVLILRDWRPKEALREDYPKSQVMALPIPLWSMERATAFLATRIREHVAATPRPCTHEERWHQPDKWALMKKGRKTAIKLFEAPPDHVELAKDQFVEKRPGAFRRCESYCPVAAHCAQWAADKPAEPMSTEEALQESIARAHAYFDQPAPEDRAA
jgi:hypothetical protein